MLCDIVDAGAVSRSVSTNTQNSAINSERVGMEKMAALKARNARICTPNYVEDLLRQIKYAQTQQVASSSISLGPALPQKSRRKKT